jgi:hypothetical protein
VNFYANATLVLLKIKVFWDVAVLVLPDAFNFKIHAVQEE